MKIVITDADTIIHDGDLDLSVLSRFGQLEIFPLTNPGELVPRCADADAVLCNKTRFTAETLEKCERLKYIGLFATGYNNIDLAAAKARGITVANAPGYSTNAVAQHTFALILELVNRTRDYRNLVIEGDWVRSRTFSLFPLPIIELAGKTIGIIGFGAIGQSVAKIAAAFGMNVLVHTRTIRDSGYNYAELDALLRESDIVSLHCPLTEENQRMMNAAAFSQMKRGAIFINTARGGLVDETALAASLKAGHISAGLDVLETEPMTPECPLYALPNCVITPHIAWAGLESRRRLLDMVYDNLAAFWAGKAVNVVN